MKKIIYVLLGFISLNCYSDTMDLKDIVKENAVKNNLKIIWNINDSEPLYFSDSSLEVLRKQSAQSLAQFAADYASTMLYVKTDVTHSYGAAQCGENIFIGAYEDWKNKINKDKCKNLSRSLSMDY